MYSNHLAVKPSLTDVRVYELPCPFFFFTLGVGTGTDAFRSIMAATGSSMGWTACKTL